MGCSAYNGDMKIRYLTALPVYNEIASAAAVVAGARNYSQDVLVVDDGSTDGTDAVLRGIPGIHVVRHERNRGYGAALRSAFDFAIRHGYEALVTIDCDGQHQPQLIPRFVETLSDTSADIVSGSRYLRRFEGDTPPPADRQRINAIITAELNRLLGLRLTDAFCGFKAYRTTALERLHLTETGYAMPLELWVQAAALRMRIVELAVPMIYLDEKRSFGGALDNAEHRLAEYRRVIAGAMHSANVPTEFHRPVISPAIEPLCSG